MTGLRRRVSVGFLSIAILLFISGVIAFFELNTLSQDTKSILSVNNRKMELAQQMLGVVQAQDAAFIKMTIFEDQAFDDVCIFEVGKLKSMVNTAIGETNNRHLLDSLSSHIASFESLIQDVASQPQLDTLNIVTRASYYESYLPIQTNIINSIYELTTSSFLTMEPRAEQLQRNAYRAVTPVFISLVVMIVIVLLLYYFMIIYCVNPIVRLNRSLGDFITYKLPFVSKSDCGDEVAELQEKIEIITSQKRREK